MTTMDNSSYNQLIGSYRQLVYSDEKQAEAYQLFIEKETHPNKRFTLERVISGQFGSIGESWKGNYDLKGDILLLNVEVKEDWKFTFLEDEKETERSNLISLTITSEIKHEDENVVLKFNFNGIELEMKKRLD